MGVALAVFTFFPIPISKYLSQVWKVTKKTIETEIISELYYSKLSNLSKLNIQIHKILFQ